MRKFALIVLLALMPFLGRAQSREYTYPETWLQITPAVFYLGSAEIGLECKSTFAERMVTASLAFGVNTFICYTLKTIVREERPDGSRFNSFPSAHTAAAFVGAELIRGDYGNGPGSAFYAGGIYVGAMRVQHQRHWWWDTLAGAGIGIASVFIARALEEPVWNLLESWGVQRSASSNISIAPACDLLTGALCANVAIRF
ncbi:MAG: phosphatase PAP2 family protein [Candidatus Cryptobacteroides sp.]